MNLFTITIPDSAAALLVTYGDGALIRVQSSPTEGGIYGDVTTIPIVAGVSVYAVYDELGASTDWYAIRYEGADGDPAGTYSAAFQPQVSSELYGSLADFKVYARADQADDTDNVIMLLALDAAARAIDRACGRNFFLATGDTTDRYFTAEAYNDPWPCIRIPIDDLFDDSAPTVAADQTGNGDYTLSVTAFRLGPINAPQRGKPYSELILDRGVYVPAYEAGIKVTTNWGWQAVPSTIVNANFLQANRYLKRRDAPFGVAGSPDMGSELRLLAKLDPDVELMVQSYKRRWGAV